MRKDAKRIQAWKDVDPKLRDWINARQHGVKWREQLSGQVQKYVHIDFILLIPHSFLVFISIAFDDLR